MEEAVRFALLGLGTGALYALASQGLIVIYRGSGVLNFALGGDERRRRLCVVGAPLRAGVGVRTGGSRRHRRRRDARRVDPPSHHAAIADGVITRPCDRDPRRPHHAAGGGDPALRLQPETGPEPTAHRPGDPVGRRGHHRRSDPPVPDRLRADPRPVGALPVHPVRAVDVRRRGERAVGRSPRHLGRPHRAVELGARLRASPRSPGSSSSRSSRCRSRR